MGFRQIILITLTLLVIAGCAAKEEKVIITPVKPQEELQPKVTKPLPPPPPPVLRSAFREVNPLEGQVITFNADLVPVSHILFAIASDVGMNLVISPDVPQTARVTANFVNMPVKDALAVVMDMADVFYSIDGNTLTIHRYQEKQIHVPFIRTTTTYGSDLGGDVLGGAGREVSASLSGRFTVSYRTPDGAKDFYTQLEENIKDILAVGEQTQVNNTDAKSGADDADTRQAVAGNPTKEEFFTLNRYTGVLTVRTTRRKMERIDSIITRMKAEIGRQVLIEAKIVDVTLNDLQSYGIDWNAVFQDSSVSMSQSLGLPDYAAQVSVVDTNFLAVLNAVATFGKVDTLANPRIRVVNGQSAVISAGTLNPYWTKNVVETETRVTTSYTKSTVLEGVMLGVTPYINSDGTITLNIVPVSTNILETKQVFENDEVAGEAPVLSVKEAGSIIQVRDGAMVVMGGLMTEQKSVSERKIPLLGDIPWLGNLFKRQTTSVAKRELVILLKPTLVNVATETSE